MLTVRSGKVAKNKMVVIIPIALVCILCFSKSAFSQEGKSKIDMSLFGSAVPKGIGRVHRTYDEASATPMLVCNDTGYTLVTYSISFLPKGNEFYGPLKQETTKMTDKAVDAIKKYKNTAGDTTRMFVDDIKLRNNKTGAIVSVGSWLCDLTIK